MRRNRGGSTEAPGGVLELRIHCEWCGFCILFVQKEQGCQETGADHTHCNFHRALLDELALNPRTPDGSLTVRIMDDDRGRSFVPFKTEKLPFPNPLKQLLSTEELEKQSAQESVPVALTHIDIFPPGSDMVLVFDGPPQSGLQIETDSNSNVVPFRPTIFRFRKL